jgi:hypothetical protein
MMASRPPASATFIRPRNSAIIPTSPIARVTAPPAESTTAWVRTSMGEDAAAATPGSGSAGADQVSSR